MTNITSANGVSGHLLYVHGANKYVFRVYNLDNYTFIDYDIRHCDLTLTITDEDAFFYSNGNTDVLDHAPSTLGK